MAERRGPLLEELPARLPCTALDARGRLATAAQLIRSPETRRGDVLRWSWRNRLGRSLLPLAAFLRRERPSVLVTTLPKNALLALWARQLAGVETHVVVREANTFSLEAAKGAASKEALLTRLARRHYSRADAIVAVSEGVARDLSATLGLSPTRITTVYNAVDADAIAKRSAEPLDDAWFGAGAPPVIVTAGRLAHQKDHETLLRAFALLRRQRPARLIVLGEGSRRNALEALARALGVDADVRFPGFVANPYRFMARGAAFASSSRWEGFPNVLVEALACGCPVVSTDCPHGPAEILARGAYGTLCAIGDAEALARALVGALDAPPDRGALRRRARDFAPERTLERYLEVMFPDREASSGASTPPVASP